MFKKNLTSREKIKFKIKKKISGTPERPRLVVFRSLNNIYAQLIDDTTGKTLVSVSTLSKDVKGSLKDKKRKTDQSVLVGKRIAELALQKGIKKVVFDRNGYLYHGRVKAVADSAREGGLEF
ncbi:MAG: 50S ribosomal protein L18 [Ignavibacteria bacterium]|nr:50S ribosomal protein L18 [Ignavibacteria bacterium]